MVRTCWSCLAFISKRHAKGADAISSHSRIKGQNTTLVLLLTLLGATPSYGSIKSVFDPVVSVENVEKIDGNSADKLVSGGDVTIEAHHSPEPGNALPSVELPAAELLVGAWNVQVFGRAKVGRADVVAELVRVLRRYDVVAVQEVRDASQTAVPALLTSVNEGFTADNQQQYDVLVSARLGATSSKEQYAWFWRVDHVAPVASWNAAEVDADGVSVEGAFNRVPHAVRWRVLATGHEFSAFVLHADPDDAVAELHALSVAFGESYEGSTEATGDVGALLFGDFNAECRYVTATQWACIRDLGCVDHAMGLWNTTRFAWLLDDTHDTTTKATDCAYDRVVATVGAMADGAVVPGSARVFRFDLEPTVLKADLVTRTSDHYPVEVRLVFGDAQVGVGGGMPDSGLRGSNTACEATEAVPTPTAALTSAPTSMSAPTTAFGELVCVNTAGEGELADSLHGIGPVKAARIVSDRAANGPYSDLGEMTRIRGIGDATLDGFRHQATTACDGVLSGGGPRGVLDNEAKRQAQELTCPRVP